MLFPEFCLLAVSTEATASGCSRSSYCVCLLTNVHPDQVIHQLVEGIALVVRSWQVTRRIRYLIEIGSQLLVELCVFCVFSEMLFVVLDQVLYVFNDLVL